MISRHIVKVFIIISSSFFYLSCSSEIDEATANASGQEMVYQYYRSFPGTEEIDFQHKKINVLEGTNELLKRLRDLNKEERRLYADCPKECKNEINALRLQISASQKKITKLTESLLEIQAQELSQNVIAIGIYKSIERSCGRSDRVALYDQFMNQLFSNLDEEAKKELEFHGVDSIYNTVYTDTNEDLESGQFIIDCSWGILDVFEKTVSEKIVLMKSANKKKN